MSELTITLLRLGYLALLWFLVLSAITVLRRDLYGTRIIDRRRSPGKAAPAAESPVPIGEAPRSPRRPRGTGGPTRLVVTEGPLRGTTLPLGSSAVLVGRAPSCTLVLDDDYSSSRHARIFPQGEQWFVEDLGSTNGTFVGEQRVEQPTAVPTGTPVRVGQSLLELQR
ncbi:FHA domain-containing protein [Cellulomonas sp. S1-8]|uniref:FHA domain-containing protein FhaB/FipA n=1 Tax=Cellulomonas sp. S1-8 TaxID=2904790 RepID=UPI002244CD0B|nr:FHA domain-containing protein [Cellulomonas sp. S1-8]UZN03396.1 FHA domain-containing protein [Cellulomonas sp. S1-8]